MPLSRRSARALLGALTAFAVTAESRAEAPLPLPETAIAYRIDASLDPASRALKGTEEIRWKNRTDEPLAVLPLHLYLNAFSHLRTTWMREAGPERFQARDFLSREPDPWGYIEAVSVRQRLADGERDASLRPIQPDDGNPLDRTLAEVTLAEPVPPGGEIVLSIVFEGRLPVPIARTGGVGSGGAASGGRDFFLVAQWYPKIGVIEPAGVRHAPKARSAARQFHGATEFYADFADYDVSFATPEGWLIGATGRAEGDPQKDGSGASKVRYKQRAVHDFALVVGRGLADRWARYAPKGGGPAVDVRYIVTNGTEHQIPRWQKAVEGSLDVLGSRVGPYPYDTLTVVLMPFWASRTAGMEYPTLITGAPADPLWDHPLLARMYQPEAVIVHEFGHQYFYGLLASNEQEEAFLDEGFNTYWESEVMRAIYGDERDERDEASSGYLLGRPVNGADLRALGLALTADIIVEPIRKRPAWLFREGTWGPQIYSRSAVTFATAAGLFGQEKVDKVFAEYFRRYVFKHPDADDFLAVAAEVGGPDFDAFCREAFDRERIPDYAVTDVTSEAWRSPLGRVMTAEGPVVVTAENREKLAEVGLPLEAREEDGRVLVEITDSGFTRGGQSATGSITRSLVTPERGAPKPGYAPGGFQESYVRIEGPGWDTLPVEVEIRFADGAVVRDQWDGKASWRKYRFIRKAPILDARVDRGGRIAVDVNPQNNGLAASPDGGFAADFGMWLGAAAEWLAGGLSLWL
jgi:hypothetical protein